MKASIVRVNDGADSGISGVLGYFSRLLDLNINAI
jgi:hypothetical protein